MGKGLLVFILVGVIMGAAFYPLPSAWSVSAGPGAQTVPTEGPEATETVSAPPGGGEDEPQPPPAATLPAPEASQSSPSLTPPAAGTPGATADKTAAAPAQSAVSADASPAPGGSETMENQAVERMVPDAPRSDGVETTVSATVFVAGGVLLAAALLAAVWFTLKNKKN